MRGCFVFFGGYRWRMTAAFDGIPWYFSCGPYISLDECWSTGEGNQEGSWGGGRGDEHQHLKDKRNNCQRSDGLWGTEAGAGGGRHGLKKRRMRKRRSSSSSMRGDFSTPGVVSWRSSEAEGGTEGGAAASVGLRPRWNDAPARAKKTETQNRLTMFMRCLLAKDGLSTNTAATINTSPYLCFAAGSYTEPAGLRGRRQRSSLRTLGANVGEEPAEKQTNVGRFSRAQTKLLPSQHSTVLRDKGRGEEEGRDHFITPLMKFYKKQNIYIYSIYLYIYTVYHHKL